MNGSMDGSGRALVRIRLMHPTDSSEVELDAWIDTGFTGELVLPQENLKSLGLPLGPSVMARLAGQVGQQPAGVVPQVGGVRPIPQVRSEPSQVARDCQAEGVDLLFGHGAPPETPVGFIVPSTAM